MKVAIHQPHFMPWLGYFDKMKKVDKFILMDMVQLENKSYMCRNRILNRNGEIVYLTVPCKKKGYREKEYREIEIDNTDKWQKRCRQILYDSYRGTPYIREVLDVLEPLFENKYEYLIEVVCESIFLFKEILGIETELVLQSSLNIEKKVTVEDECKEIKRNRDVLDICLAVDADVYITGSGKSLTFLNKDSFVQKGIEVYVQDYSCPIYTQYFSKDFIANLSMADLLANCGIKRVREIFDNNINWKDKLL